MRIEIILFLITAFLVANIYTEGKYYKVLLSWKKYYQMAGIVLGAFMIYWLLKKNPKRANDIIRTSNEYLKYMPMDQNTSSIISPILDFTAKQSFNEAVVGGALAGTVTTNPILNLFSPNPSYSEKRLLESGGVNTNGIVKTKRSVSETKKKFVASKQNWKCGDCGEQLSAWFEVDHKVRLEYGGSNHINNLVALCRECHGKKTTIENL
jgi:plastocyanin domain-containing protein